MKNLEYYTFNLAEDILDKILEYITARFKIEEFRKLCIIFGGKRPGVVFRKLLAEKIKQDFFSPSIFSVDEFVVYSASKFKEINFVYELDAVYLLYEIVYRNIPFLRKKFKNFFEFLGWGYEIFNFLEELTLEDIPDDKLLNIQKEAEIGFNVPPTINELLKEIVTVKQKFYETLENKNLSTRGMLYKLVSQNQELQFEEFHKIIFVTPFYLHNTEYKFIRNLIDKNKIIIFFQGDQKDWKQLENLSKKLGIKITPPEKENQLPEMYFYSTVDVESEVLCAHEILKGVSENDLNEVLVVVPDDNTGISLINYLPLNVKEFNFVCGYPVKRSVFYSLLESIFNAQITKKGTKYHTKSYLSVITNKLIRNLNLSDYPNTTAGIVETIEAIIAGKIEDETITGSSFIKITDILKSKVLYENLYENFSKKNIIISKKALRGQLKTIHDLLFYQWEEITSFKDFCIKLEKLLNYILKFSLATNYSFNLEVMDKLFNLVELLKNISFRDLVFSKEEIFKIFLNELENIRISFSGSPVKGLQILGFYETRNLSFKKVIILDVNEGVLPYLKVTSSLVPAEILIKLGINRVEIEEEIQRYHFFRLIYSAKEVHLIYIESKDKEKSRFLEQILWNKQKQTKQLTISNIYHGIYEIEILSGKQKISKNSQIIEILLKMIYSPTAVDTYIHCPMKFYFRYVLNLSEDDILEEPEGKQIGKFVHEFLQAIFKKYVKRKPVIDEVFIKDALDFLEESFNKKLKKSFKTDSLLIEEVMKFVLREFLLFEKERLSTQKVKEIISLESNFQKVFHLNDNKFCFSCRIDRIDKLEDDTLLVIDYKTGNIMVMKKDLQLNTSLSREVIKKQIKSLQLPLYVEVVKEKFQTDNINAMFYDVKNLEYKLLFDEKTDKDKVLIITNKALKYILEEIINPHVPFVADDTDTNLCSNCNFYLLCR